MIDQSPVSTYITDENGTQIRVNEACLKLFNVPDHELGLGKYNILKDEILQKHFAYKDVQEVFTKGKVAKFEIDYDLANESHIDIKRSKPLSLIGTVFPIINRYGKVTNAVVQHQDVTEQKVAVQKIKESAERFRLLLETIPQMAFTILPDGTNNYFNERWYKYTGNQAIISGGPVWKNIIHSDDIGTTASKWRDSFSSGKVYEMENRLRRANDNMYRWHLTRAVPIINDQGKIILWVGTCTDIHDHRIVEEQIIAKNLELTKINADLDNFIYTASHDLKAPVTNLEGLITLLNQQIQNHLNEKDDRLFDMMKVSISKFKSTIAGLVEITKAQKNLEKVDEKVDISEVINDVIVNIDYLVVESGATIFQDLSVKEVMYAKVNINSIVYNLLSNAIKYRSPERKPVVYIRTFTINENVVLEVEDNGLGIRKIHQNKLFTMFKRLHSHVEGTGIGLYIIKRIVENNGGNIKVESEEGKGTKFIVNFGNMKFTRA